MSKKIVLSAVLGGLVFYVWSFIAHGVLPYYHNSFRSFANEQAATDFISANAAKSDMYFLPFYKFGDEEAQKGAIEKMERGPIVFTVVQAQGSKGMVALLGQQLVWTLISTWLLTLLLLQADNASISGRLTMSLAVGLIVVFIHVVPYWTWYGFNAQFTIVQSLDILGGFALAGLVIGKILQTRPTAETVPAKS